MFRIAARVLEAEALRLHRLKLVFIALVVGAGPASLAAAATTINVGNFLLLPNTPGQVISIQVAGGDAAPGADLAVQVGDGGPELTTVGLPAGTPGPRIIDIGLTTGTIFGVPGASQFTPSGNIPQVWFTNVALLGNQTSVAASGVLANITIDTTGFSYGSFPLLLKNVVPALLPPGGASTDLTNAVPNLTITNGAITVIPATAYWKGNVDGNWSTNNAGVSNWKTDAGGATDTQAAPGVASDVFFTTTSGAANLSTTLDADFSIKGLTFTSAATIPVSISGSHTLALGVDGLTMQSGAATATIASPIDVVTSQTWSVAGVNPLVINGAVTVRATTALTKSGSGTVRINSAPAIGNNAALNVTAGTLRLNATTGSALIGSGVTATVSPGATLELGGSVSALSSATSRTVISNDSQAAGGGLLVSGTNQQVGAIDGNGNTVVGDGAGLTANHIVQNALFIGGSANNLSLVTLAASDESGNSLAASAAIRSSSLLAASPPLSPSISLSASFTTGGTGEFAPAALGSHGGTAFNSVGAAVPEPASVAMLALGAVALASNLRRKAARLRGLLDRNELSRRWVATVERGNS